MAMDGDIVESSRFFFSTTKSDQTGETTSEVKRLFANPFKPEICVVYGLAIYTWCKRRNPGDSLLFDGRDQNKRYYNILINACESIPAHINLGCERNDIGTHSNRKFAESTCASKIDGPSRTQVCLQIIPYGCRQFSLIELWSIH